MPILAAGGIVLRPAETPLVAVVRLRKRNEWVLPKGKLDDGETWEDAALREVWEETGIRAALREELSPVEYTDPKGRPKTVRYWRMEPLEGDFVPNSEVDELRWLPVDEALRCLTYDHDRELVLMAARPGAEER